MALNNLRSHPAIHSGPKQYPRTFSFLKIDHLKNDTIIMMVSWTHHYFSFTQMKVGGVNKYIQKIMSALFSL